MVKRTKLATAIKLAALGAAGAAILSTTPVFAQDDISAIEEVMVTGSRIKRSNFSEAAQVIAMDREYIDALGTLTIADTLRSSPLNSLGSFSERSGSSAQSNATIDLRGLGSDRTLVMLNSRRLPGSPSLGASSVNINMIPMIAIERVDILADGASAVYGSDAVAGVVNMMTRDNFEGLEFQIRSGDRSEDDGEEQGFGFIVGTQGDKGGMTFSAEFNKRDPIFDADREYTAARWSDVDGDGIITAYAETEGVSYYGKTLEIYDSVTDYYDFQAANNCPTTGGFIGVLGGEALTGDPSHTVCGYAFGNVSANKAGLDRVNTYLTGHYELSDQVEFFTNVMFSRVESFGRYAPPAAGWPDMPEDYADVPFDIDALLANGDITVDPVTGDPNYEVYGYYRWTNIGPRDNIVTDTQYDFTGGFKGDINDNVSYEVYAQHGRYESKEFGYYYLSYPGLDYVLANDIDPFSEAGANSMRATTTQDNFTELSKMYGQVQLGVGNWFGKGDAQLLVGGEYYETSYQNQYDSQSEAGLVGGSAGNSSSGERDVSALFAEILVPVADAVEVNAAVRYDSYSDFGSNVSPTLSATWGVTDSINLRARWGVGFRAPALSELYGPETFSAEEAIDTTTCIQNTGSPTGCSKVQFDTYYSTSEDLDAETSQTLSFGGNWEFVDNWSVDVGYWSVNVEDVISQATTQDIFYAEAAGVTLSQASGTYVDRAGARPKVYSTYINAGELNVNGIDYKLAGFFDTSVGSFSFNGLLTQTLEYEQAAFFQGPIQDTSGFNLSPQFRGQMVLGWNLDAHSINLTMDYIGEHDAEDELVLTAGTGGSLNGELVQSGTNLDSWTTWNLSYAFDADQYGKIKVGARNLTNEEPVFDKDGKYGDGHPDLYDNTGRVIYAEYVIKF